MGFTTIGDVPVVKGPVPYCLEQISRGRGAGDRLRQLTRDIRSIAPSYRGLENVFDKDLLAYVFNKRQRKIITEHLRSNWFDESSPETFFPGQAVAPIYAKGVLKALQLSLKGRRAVPINCWWIIDTATVSLLTLADVEQGTTLDTPITLLILTPRPSVGTPTKRNPIMGKIAKAWVSRSSGGQIATTAVR